MKTETAVKHAGSPKALAELLSITPSAISQWGEEVPQAREWQLRVLRPEWFAGWDGTPRRKTDKADKARAF